jgi:hypothetical protein
LHAFYLLLELRNFFFSSTKNEEIWENCVDAMKLVGLEGKAMSLRPNSPMAQKGFWRLELPFPSTQNFSSWMNLL